MKYKVISLAVKQIPEGKQNAGDSYVQIVASPEYIWDDQDVQINLFPSQQKISMFQALADKPEDLAKMPFYGEHVVVESLPAFQTYRSNTTTPTLDPIVRNSMRVFVRMNDEGKHMDDPRATALRTISRLCKLVGEAGPAELPSGADLIAPVAAEPPVIAAAPTV